MARFLPRTLLFAWFITAVALVTTATSFVQAQPMGPAKPPVPVAAAPVLPAADPEPILRLEAGGPTSFVTALGFAPDGQALYTAGWDKVIRIWRRDAATAQFGLDARSTFRVPVGPGLSGSLNALAVSPDGVWIAAGGKSPVAHEAGFRQPGLFVPRIGAMTPEMRLDEGLIYLFNTRTRAVKLLRGHTGAVLAMQWVMVANDPVEKRPLPVLVSVALGRRPNSQYEQGEVKVWHPYSGQSYAETTFAKPQRRPAVAVWPTGKSMHNLSVAFAWGEGPLHLWDLATQKVHVAQDGRYNNTLLYLPTTKQLLSGSTGKIKVWNVAKTGVAPQLVREVTLPEQGIPRAAVAFSSKPGQPVDRSAWSTSFVNGKEIENRLLLVELPSLKLLADRNVLWPGATTLPTLAASGEMLAVGGHPEHEVRLFPLGNLIQQVPEAQVLRSVGTTYRTAAFVKNGNDLSLLLSENPPTADVAAARAPLAGDLRFDFKGRQLSDQFKGWELFTSKVHDWAVQLGPKIALQRVSLQLQQGGKAGATINLGEHELPTVWAFLPPQAPQTIPLLALATQTLGQPSLKLLNANTGEQIRELTGHTERIRSLAFSGDGRLLVSTSEDQTISVWSLTDLNLILGRRGRLSGVQVQQVQRGRDGVDVVQLDPLDNPTLAKVLASNDRIVGLVQGGKLQPFKSPQAFYGAVSLLPPGQPATFRVMLKGVEFDLPIAVNQGIDERKPILSLFVTRPDPQGLRKWVGWTPIGPYEAADKEAEQLIGWHFNTGRADAPTRFALADQYHDTYYQQGVLADIIAHGGYRPLPPAAPLPRPAMSFWLQTPDQPPLAFDEQTPGQLPGPAARLGCLLESLAPSNIAKVQWQVGNGPLQLCTHPVDDSWQADLAGVPWPAGEAPLQVVLTTNEPIPQTFSYSLRIQSQPPAAPAPAPLAAPPTWTWLAPVAPQELVVGPAEMDLPVRGQVVGNVPAGLTPVWLRNGQPLEMAAAVDPQTNVTSVPFPLIPGANRLELQWREGKNIVATGEAMQLFVRRPPLVTAVDSPAKTEQHLTQLTATIRTPVELPPLRVQVGEQVLPMNALQPGAVEQGWRTWTVTATELPLEPGENTLAVRVWNAQGACVQPGLVQVTAPARNAVAPPVLDWLSPARDVAISASRVEVQFLVRSKLPLVRVELANRGTQVYQADQLGAAVPGADGWYTLMPTVPVTLARGANLLRLSAVNAAGETVSELVVSGVRQPVQIVVDRLEPATQPAVPLTPQAVADQQLTVREPLPSSQATVHGRILWGDDHDPRINDPAGLRLWVNGFKQNPPAFVEREANQSERRFTAAVVLNRATGNHLEFELAGLERAADSYPQLTVDCQQPELRQRLHLLVVGVGQPDAKALTQPLLEALRAAEPTAGKLSTPAFASVKVYGPLRGHVTPGQVTTQLVRIRTEIQLRRAREPGSDVVMVYYQGQESAGQQGEVFLLTSASQFDPVLARSAISHQNLETLLGKSPGAHLVLLDVQRDVPGAPAMAGTAALAGVWPRDSRIGLFRTSLYAKGSLPEKAQLLDTLTQTWAQAHKLRDVETRLTEHFVGLGTQYAESVRYGAHVPVDLRELVVGTP